MVMENDNEKKLEKQPEEVSKSEEVIIIEKKNDNKLKVIIAVAIALLIIASVVCAVIFFCDGKSNNNSNNNGNNSNDPNPNEPINYTSPYELDGNSLENFDLQFLKFENKEINKIYSPLSVKYALKILSDSTSGNTKRQIDAVLGNYEVKRYANSNRMSFANIMFAKDSYKNSIKDDYVTKLSTYDASLAYDSFESASKLNSSVKEKTLDKIDNIISDTDVKSSSFALVNALGIDMNWVKRIQPDDNKIARDIVSQAWKADFKHEKYSTEVPAIHNVPTKTIKFNNSIDAKVLEMGAVINNYDIISDLGRDNIFKTVEADYTSWLSKMQSSGTASDIQGFVNNFVEELSQNYGKYSSSTDFSIYTDTEVKAFSKDLDVYNGVALEYVGIMPTSKTLKEFVDNSTADSLNKIISGMKEIKPANFIQGKITEIKAYIPIFSFDYQINLTEDLKKLGIENVFDNTKAELSSLTSSENASISSVNHKASIEFSNEGLIAPVISKDVYPIDEGFSFYDYEFDVPVETIDLTFDKPFMFLIRDKESGEIWFAGTVYEPSK